MVWKVVKDAVWRMRAVYLTMSLLVALLWVAVGSEDGISTATALATSMAFAFIQGPFVGFTLFGQREFIYLPLSRRQLWHARLMVALVVPVVFMLAAKLLALAGAALLATGTLTLQTVLLSSVYDLAYVGAGLGLLAWSGITRRVILGERAARSVLSIASIPIIAMGPGWPMLFSAALATKWSQLGGPAWLLLAAGLAVALASYFRSPNLAHPGRPQWDATGRKKVSASVGRSNCAIGIARLMWPEIAVRLGGVIVLAPLAWLWFVQAARGPLAVFGFLLIVLLAPPTSVRRGAEAALRPLRALPISTWTLGGVLAVEPLVTSLSVWILFAASRLFFGPAIPVLPTALLFGLVGIASLARGVALTLTGSRLLRLGTMATVLVGFLAVGFVARAHAWPSSLAPFVALGGATAGLWLTVRALRRNNSVYRPPAVTAWFAMQGPSA
jgi:hypothetical protein